MIHSIVDFTKIFLGLLHMIACMILDYDLLLSKYVSRIKRNSILKFQGKIKIDNHYPILSQYKSISCIDSNKFFPSFLTLVTMNKAETLLKSLNICI